MIRFAPVAMLVAMALVRIAALLALMKFLAVQFGTDRFGQLSQILAIGALFSVLAGGGLTNGLVRNLAASSVASDRLAWIKAALPIAAAAAVALALVAWLLYATAAAALFPGQDLGFVLVIIALSQGVVGFGNIALAYLSGTHDIRAFTIANGAGSVLAAALVAFLAFSAGFRGAAAGCAALALLPAVVGTLVAARRIPWRELRHAAFERARAVALLRFGGSLYLAAAAVPLVWVYVRSDLALRHGWETVGLWQSVTRISDAYMQIFGVVFMNYLLPQLAAVVPADRLRRVRDIGLLIFGMFLSGASALYVFRDTILAAAFSQAFANAGVYLAPQIAGDAFKLVSLLFVYYLMAYNRASVQAWLELLQAVLIIGTYLALASSLGHLAAVVSYVIATAIVMVATLVLVAGDKSSIPPSGARTRFDGVILVGITIALAVPIILFTVAGFEVSLTLAIAPLAGFCLIRAPATLRNLFFACLAAGLASIGLASTVLGDQMSVRHVLSLVLIMTSPLYFCLGTYLCARYYDFGRLLFVLAMVSTVFVAALSVQAIATAAQVRWYTGELGLTVLNVTFIGQPLYGSFGVLSLASLLVLQLFVIAAAFMAATRRWEQAVLIFGFAAATFLVTGSNARGAQLVLPYLLVLFGLTAWRGRRQVRSRSAILLTVGALSVWYSSARMIEDLRIVTTVREVLNLPRTYEIPRDMEELSTGRTSLLQDGLSEVAISPVFGNGFDSFNRVDRSIGGRSKRSGNRTTHVHYLTILWKGGVLFFLPYMALLAMFWFWAVRGSLPLLTADVAFLFAGLVFLFTVLALTWDILLVPSAGAFAFFLLGALTQSARRAAAVGSVPPAGPAVAWMRAPG